MSKERIGILGGTFNPLHQGHIAMAIAALDTASLNRVLILPDRDPPHKNDIAPAEDRWKMVCAAVYGVSHLEPCRVELDREGTTYTYDTISHMRSIWPQAELFYIISTETLMSLHTWYRYEALLPMCTFLVCPRAVRFSPEEINAERRRLTALGGRFVSVRTQLYSVSSTEIREALAAGEPTPFLPVVIREYCGLKGLYGVRRRVEQSGPWIDRLFADLNIHRFAHTLGVAYTARSLAVNHKADPEKAEIAALLHDCAKCLPLKEMQRICAENHLTDDESVRGSGALLHAVVGAWMAEHVYGVRDPEILNAIACHTTGKPGMTKLDMVVYLADKIEPGREAFPLLSKVRMMAPLSLERAILTSMQGTADYVTHGGKALHPQTMRSIEWLRGVLNET